MSTPFVNALAALDAGDVPTLRRLLAAHPDLVTARVETAEPPYDGYFANATLLHHTAGNPIRTPLPENIVEVTHVLIEAGGDVQARVGGGPAQPDTANGSFLALLTSSGQAAERGLAYPLIDRVLEAGADINHDNGGPLWSALYHTVECQQQRDVAFYLYEKGASVDLAYAAALGDVARARSFFHADGRLTNEAYTCFRPKANRMVNPTHEEVLTEALVYACMNGRDATALLLLEEGAQLNGWARVAGFQVTPLHGAAWAGWPDLCRLLMERGADPTLVDPVHYSTAPGWAAYCKRSDAVAIFRQYPGRMDLISAIELGLLERVRALAQTMDLNAPPDWTTSGVYLRAAAAEGNLDMVDVLLANGANPNLPNPDGKTACDYAAYHGHTSVVDLLSKAF